MAKVTKRAFICGELYVHHRSLCPKRFPLSTSLSLVVHEVKLLSKVSEEKGLMSMNEMVMMQTALTDVINTETNESHPVRLPMDSGSHRSYVSEALAEKLQLQEHGKEDIHIITFGSQTAKRVATKIAIKLKNGSRMTMTVNIVPTISGELQRKPLKDLTN